MQILIINPDSSLEATEAIDENIAAMRLAGAPQLRVERPEDGAFSRLME
jgi:hypothetical protein